MKDRIIALLPLDYSELPFSEKKFIVKIIKKVIMEDQTKPKEKPKHQDSITFCRDCDAPLTPRAYKGFCQPCAREIYR